MPRHASAREAIEAAADVLAVSDLACASMTPREQAEAAWSPTSTHTVDQLEDRIRQERGLEPLRPTG